MKIVTSEVKLRNSHRKNEFKTGFLFIQDNMHYFNLTYGFCFDKN